MISLLYMRGRKLVVLFIGRAATRCTSFNCTVVGSEDITTVAFGGWFSLSGRGCCMSGEMFLVDQMTLALVNIKVSADQFVVDKGQKTVSLLIGKGYDS